MSTEVLNRPRPQSEDRRKWVATSTYDQLTRIAVALMFTLFVFANVFGAVQSALEWSHHSHYYTLLQILARVSNALFLALIAVTTITRLQPIRKAAGIEPRVSALLGTFMIMALGVLPRAELPPVALAGASALVIIGTSTSFLVLRWLGKSFSIMAEARKLITHGPYARVRHPLYICEEVAVLGMLIQVISPTAVFIVLAHALFQFRRMLNEEKILKATFVEYEKYAAQTPRLLPFA